MNCMSNQLCLVEPIFEYIIFDVYNFFAYKYWMNSLKWFEESNFIILWSSSTYKIESKSNFIANNIHLRLSALDYQRKRNIKYIDMTYNF